MTSFKPFLNLHELNSGIAGIFFIKNTSVYCQTLKAINGQKYTQVGFYFPDLSIDPKHSNSIHDQIPKIMVILSDLNSFDYEWYITDFDRIFLVPGLQSISFYKLRDYKHISEFVSLIYSILPEYGFQNQNFGKSFSGINVRNLEKNSPKGKQNLNFNEKEDDLMTREKLILKWLRYELLPIGTSEKPILTMEAVNKIVLQLSGKTGEVKSSIFLESSFFSKMKTYEFEPFENNKPDTSKIYSMSNTKNISKNYKGHNLTNNLKSSFVNLDSNLIIDMNLMFTVALMDADIYPLLYQNLVNFKENTLLLQQIDFQRNKLEVISSKISESFLNGIILPEILELSVKNLKDTEKYDTSNLTNSENKISIFQTPDKKLEFQMEKIREVLNSIIESIPDKFLEPINLTNSENTDFKIPIITLNPLIESFNEIVGNYPSSLKKLPLIKNTFSSSAIISGSNLLEISHKDLVNFERFENKEKIFLTELWPNLSKFSKDELMDLLKILEKYDHMGNLRDSVVFELSEK